MLDLKQVRQDPLAIAGQLQRRGFDFDVAAFEAPDASRKEADVVSQALLAERKSASKKIGELVHGGMSMLGDDANDDVAEGAETLLERL